MISIKKIILKHFSMSTNRFEDTSASSLRCKCRVNGREGEERKNKKKRKKKRERNRRVNEKVDIYPANRRANTVADETIVCQCERLIYISVDSTRAPVTFIRLSEFFRLFRAGGLACPRGCNDLSTPESPLIPLTRDFHLSLTFFSLFLPLYPTIFPA